jgi:hypothetical protein
MSTEALSWGNRYATRPDSSVIAADPRLGFNSSSPGRTWLRPRELPRPSKANVVRRFIGNSNSSRSSPAARLVHLDSGTIHLRKRSFGLPAGNWYPPSLQLRRFGFEYAADRGKGQTGKSPLRHARVLSMRIVSADKNVTDCWASVIGQCPKHSTFPLRSRLDYPHSAIKLLYISWVPPAHGRLTPYSLGLGWVREKTPLLTQRAGESVSV